METDQKTKKAQTRIIDRTTFDPKTYEADFSFKPYDKNEPLTVHTTAEMVECLAKNPTIELDARVLHLRKTEGGKISVKTRPINKTNFLEAFHKDVAKGLKIREDSFGGQNFGSGFFNANGNLGNSLVGDDFTPLLGGPFYKNLYFYQDYMRMHAEAFYSYHNDPIAHAIIEITKHFVLGSGYEMQCDSTTTQGKVATAAWKAYEEANNLPLQIDQCITELGIYGEVMWWKLPGMQSKITYRLNPGDTRPIGMIPRSRLMDPSNFVEIVTYPEDITRPLFYVWLQPTQYQIYNTGLDSSGQTTTQPTLKFIYRQIPAAEMRHYRINCVSNEKRGRSDLFPIFNYLKRLRDAVNYEMISLEKVSAWSIDTTIEGDQTDIDAYVMAQRALGTIPPPGSEHVHSKGITRSYNGNQHAAGRSSDIMQWCLSMIAAGSGIPVSWFGTHLSGGQTRASALVATEPVTKRMEHRREVVKRILKDHWKDCMEAAGLPNLDCNVVLPELITQDRSQKLKDLLLAEQARWIKPERAATIAAKELGQQNFNYQNELQDMDEQIPEIPMPLVDPGAINPPQSMQPGQPEAGAGSGQDGFSSGGALNSGLSSTQKSEIQKNDSTL